MHDLGAGALHAPILNDVVNLSEHGAISCMANPIAKTGLTKINERAGKDRLPFGRESDFDRIIHAAGHDDVQVRAVGTRAVDVGGLVVQRAAIAELVGLLGESTLRPVDIAVRAEVGTVDVVGAARERAALEPLFAMVRDTIVI